MTAGPELARNLRAAERARRHAIDAALAGYDIAVTAAQRQRAGFRLVNALDEADRQYERDKAEAFALFHRLKAVAPV